MKILRGLVLILASVCLIAGLNFMVIRESLFDREVTYPLGAGIALLILWFLLFALSFLGKGQKGTPHGLNTIVGSLAFLGICVLLFAFIQRMELGWDLTLEGRRELSPQTMQVLESLTEDITAYCLFIKAGDDRSITAQKKTVRFLERCQQFSDKLIIKQIDPQVDTLTVQELEVMHAINIGVVVLKSESRKIDIPLTSVSARLEERDFTNALINVSRQQIPQIYFLGGHGGRDITDQDPKKGGHMLAQILLRESYKVAEWVIPANNPNLPENCSLLIINNYESDLYTHEIEVIDHYLSNGGRILVLSDVHLFQQKGVEYKEQLRPWLKSRLGIDLVPDIIYSPAAAGYRINIIPDYRLLGDFDYEETPEFRGSFHAGHPITRTFDQYLILDNVRSVILTDPMPEKVTGLTILRTTPDTWGEKNIQGAIDRIPAMRDGNDVEGPNSIVVAVTKLNETPSMDGGESNDGRIVVVGDADISANAAVTPGSASANFLLNSIAWLTENDDLIAIRPTGQESQPLVLSDEERRAIAWMASLAAVQLIGIAGLITWVVRRRNQ